MPIPQGGIIELMARFYFKNYEQSLPGAVNICQRAWLYNEKAAGTDGFATLSPVLANWPSLSAADQP